MVALLELLLGLFVGALVLLEATGKTDFLGRRKRQELVERYEDDLQEPDDGEGDNGPRF